MGIDFTQSRCSISKQWQSLSMLAPWEMTEVTLTQDMLYATSKERKCGLNLIENEQTAIKKAELV